MAFMFLKNKPIHDLVLTGDATTFDGEISFRRTSEQRSLVLIKLYNLIADKIYEMVEVKSDKVRSRVGSYLGVFGLRRRCSVSTLSLKEKISKNSSYFLFHSKCAVNRQ